jgi:hypothetical protein
MSSLDVTEVRVFEGALHATKVAQHGLETLASSNPGAAPNRGGHC